MPAFLVAFDHWPTSGNVLQRGYRHENQSEVLNILAGVRLVNRPRGPVARSIPRNISLFNHGVSRRSESLALFHRGEERIPRPVLGAVHVPEQVLPSINLDLARPVHVEPVNGRTACMPTISFLLALRGREIRDLQAPCHEAIQTGYYSHWPEGRFRTPSSAASTRGSHSTYFREYLDMR